MSLIILFLCQGDCKGFQCVATSECFCIFPETAIQLKTKCVYYLFFTFSMLVFCYLIYFISVRRTNFMTNSSFSFIHLYVNNHFGFLVYCL